jgi:hypothetical protein
MKKIVFAFAALALVACGKEEAAPTAAAGSSAKAAAPAGSTMPAAAAPKAEAKPEAKPAAAQKGLEAGQVVVGYLKDPKDEGQCAALAAPEAEKAKYDAAKLGEVAKMLKSEVVASCPTDGVVGVCSAMGMLVNYTGPKYTKESAQADCTKTHGKWIE